MQDKAIVAIGAWQLEQKKDLEEVDLYVENMFPGKESNRIKILIV